ncbi:MAG TPA: hypothetical protein VGC76_18595 [Pyrinomonadaceae bacterium]|jgi:hypothetical protein
MMKDLIKYALFLLVLCGFSAGCASAQNVSDNKEIRIDLSSDEAVIAELQKIIDTKNSALANGDEKLDAKRKVVSRLEAKDVCIKRIKGAEIIDIGFFRTEAGCRFEGAFINSIYFERSGVDLSKKALAALGWEKSPKSEREKLAALWVEKGLLVFSPLPQQSISAVSIAGEKIKITAASKYPPGVRSRNVTKVFVFDSDGGLSTANDY